MVSHLLLSQTGNIPADSTGPTKGPKAVRSALLNLPLNYPGPKRPSPRTLHIHALSPETLQLIFSEACVEDSLTTSKEIGQLDYHLEGSFRPTTLSIAGVCKFWRRTILDPTHTNCWASFVLSDKDLSKLGTSQLLSRLKLYLARSRNSTLYIRALFTRRTSNHIRNALVRHAHRWGSIDLQATTTFLLAFSRVICPTPRLRHIDINMIDGDPYSPIRPAAETTPSITFTYTPALDHLVLGRLDPLHWDFNLERAGDKLRQFFTYYMRLSDTLRVARTLPALTHLILYVALPSLVCARPQRLSFPKIRLLQFRMCGTFVMWVSLKGWLKRARDALAEILDTVETPALKDLTVSFPTWTCGDAEAVEWEQKWKLVGGWPMSSFCAFLGSTLRGTLTKLSLHCAAINADDLMGCLATLPRLETFDFEEPPSFRTEKMVKWLTRFEALDEPWAAAQYLERCDRLPRLRNLELSGKLLVDDDMIVTMLESRMKHLGGMAAFEDAADDTDERDGDCSRRIVEMDDEDSDAKVGMGELDLTSAKFTFRGRRMEPAAWQRLKDLIAPDHKDCDHILIKSVWDWDAVPERFTGLD